MSRQRSAGQPEPILLSAPAVAHALGIGDTLSRELIASGAIRSVQINRRRLVHRDDLEAYAQSLRGAA